MKNNTKESKVPPSFLVDGLPIWVLDNLLTNSQHDFMYSYCLNSLYTPNHSSDDRLSFKNQRMVSRLTKEQMISLPLNEAYKDIIKQLDVDIIFSEAYINVYSSDSVCVSHIDSNVFGLTFLYYPNLNWDINHGGETMFFNEESEVAFTSKYKPNRLLVFDARLKHLAKTPTTISEDFRYTIAHKGVAQ